MFWEPMEYSEQVIVLQVGKFRENDMWLRLLSPTRGIYSAFAFGGSRSKQRFAGCLDIFNQVVFRVKAGELSGYSALQEGVLVKGVSRLRSDWSRLGIARNCAKFLQAFGAGPEGAEKAHLLLEQTLEALESDNELPVLFPLFFRVRLAFDQGYSIGLESCDACGVPLHTSVLFVHEGLVVCPKCGSYRQGARVRLGPEALHTLRQVRDMPPHMWRTIHLPAGNVKSECSMAIDGFIQYHVGLCWDNGRFIRI